jgi:hypothetical protein
MYEVLSVTILLIVMASDLTRALRMQLLVTAHGNATVWSIPYGNVAHAVSCEAENSKLEEFGSEHVSKAK